MKKIIFFLVLFFLAFPVLAKEKVLLGLGDSITTGYGVEEKERYFSLLCTHFQAETPTICENEAVNGLTSSELLEQLHTDSIQAKLKEADTIVFSIGGNDYLHELTTHLLDYLGVTSDLSRFDQVSDQLLQNVEQILKEIKAQKETVQILVVPLYNPYYELLKQNTSLMKAFQNVQAKYTELVKKYGEISETLGMTIQNEAYLNASKTNLDPHPTVLGHALIAEELLSLVAEPKEAPSYFPLIIGLLLLLILVSLFTFFQTKKKFHNSFDKISSS